MEHVSEYRILKSPPHGGAHGQKGKRPTMEDAHFYASWCTGPSRIFVEYFGVLDGHGGGKVSKQVRTILPWIVAGKLRDLSSPAAVRTQLIDAFETTQRYLRGLSKFQKQGTTAATVLKIGPRIYTANVGDSRVILLRGRNPMPLSRDHKPEDPKEKARIEQLGGTVSKEGSDSDYRVWPVGLSTSRSLGDTDSRRLENGTELPEGTYLVSPTPDVTMVVQKSTDQFLVVVCDGVTDVLNNADICRTILSALNTPASPNQACEALVQKALERDTHDNVTCMLYPLATRGKDPTVIDTSCTPRNGRVKIPIPGRGPVSANGEIYRTLKDMGYLNGT